MIDTKIILCSASPRRKELLSTIYSEEIEIIIPDIDEDNVQSENIELLAETIAEQKLHSIQGKSADRIYISADTIVVLGSKMLGKPKDNHDAKQMLHSLSEKSHKVITGVCIYYKNEYHRFSEITKVTFDTLSDEMIDYYVESYQVLDKAGSYGIQDWIGKVGISKIEGCYYNVMGLPVNRLYNELLEIL